MYEEAVQAYNELLDSCDIVSLLSSTHSLCGHDH